MLASAAHRLVQDKLLCGKHADALNRTGRVNFSCWSCMVTVELPLTRHAAAPYLHVLGASQSAFSKHYKCIQCTDVRI
jgi:hypothetical protein